MLREGDGQEEGENGRGATTSGKVAVDLFNGLLRSLVEKVKGFSKALEEEMEEATTTMKEQADRCLCALLPDSRSEERQR